MVRVDVQEQEQAIDRPRHFRRFGGFMGGVRLVFDGAILLLVMLIIGFVVFANSIDRQRREPAYAADGITVLTGGSARIHQAMRLLAKGKAKRVLITGVNRGTTREQLKRFASHSDQYFACCVDIDKEARNTIDNATETAEWVALHRYGSIIVVTSNYHMPRALAELARALPDVMLIAYPVVDNNAHVERWWNYIGTTRLLLSEYLKYLPALARLGATKLVRIVVPGDTSTTEAGPEP
jgi:uncharacterized SAM-binding protein YcdF (DUF218 family)